MTKHYIISDTLNVGQYFEHDDILYVAAKMSRSRSCLTQCHALHADRCLGLCCRFRNDGFVLKKAKPTEEHITVIETEFGKSVREQAEEYKQQLEQMYIGNADRTD